jgi:LysM repeat protein
MKILRSLASLLIIALLSGCGNNDKNPDARDEKNPSIRKALSQIEARQFGEALMTLEDALEKNPDLARAHLEAAHICRSAPDDLDYPRAIYHYEQYLAKRPDTQKAPLIQKWINQAQVNFVDEIMQSNPTGFMVEVNRLKRENASLRRLVEQYTADTNAVPAQINSAEPIVPPKPAPQPVLQPAPEPIPVVVTPIAEPVRTYTVQKGDTLSAIARKTYSDAKKWNMIYQANRAKMKSASDLKIGQVLIIPSLGEDEKPRG